MWWLPHPVQEPISYGTVMHDRATENCPPAAMAACVSADAHELSLERVSNAANIRLHNPSGYRIIE